MEYRSEDDFQELVFSSTSHLWVLRIELGLSSMVAVTVTCLTISLTP